jgi:steroid delta-isomerase-like uncharacterized protein
MSTLEENKALVRRFFEELWNQGNMTVADELLAPTHVHHFPDGDVDGPDGVKQLVSMLRTAFPDFHMRTDDVIAEADKVVMRFTIRGTHQGEGMGSSPTGKVITYTGIDIFRIAEGKIVERWGEIDAVGLMRQLGTFPTAE